MRDLYDSEKRFVDPKEGRRLIRQGRISSKFYSAVKKEILKEISWEEVFETASFNECVWFIKSSYLYSKTSGMLIFPRERMLEIIEKEKGEMKYWLLVRAIPFFIERNWRGDWSINGRFLNEEVKVRIKNLADEIKNQPDYMIFVWAARGEGNLWRRKIGGRKEIVGKYLINEINIKASENGSKKSQKIRAFKKEGSREKFPKN